MEGSERDESATVPDRPLNDGPLDDGLAALRQSLPDLDGWRLIGRGGFATVYAARQERLGRQVAVKLLSDRPSPTVVRWFLRECEVMGSLSSHPHIVTIYDAGVTDDGRPYLVMEHLPGGSLADRIAGGTPLPWHEVVSIGTSVAGALAAAHERGVLHLDVKPANVIMSEYGATKLGDFGIARLETSGATTSVVPFSPFYVAPETIDGQRPTRATDVYALGATLATLVRGRPLHWRAEDNAVSSVIARTVTEPIPPFDDLAMPNNLREIITQMLDRDPAKRPTVDSARAALADVEREFAPPRATTTAVTTTAAGSAIAAGSLRRRRIALAALALGAVALIVSVAVLANRRSGTTVPTTAVTPTSTSSPATTSSPLSAATSGASPPATTALLAVASTSQPPSGTSGDRADLFPAIAGATWQAAPDATVALVKSGIAAHAPDAYIKSADLRLLEVAGRSHLVFRFDLQDATLDPATFRATFVRGALLGDYDEKPAGSGAVFVPKGGGTTAVFAGQDHAGWVVNGDTTQDAIDTAIAIMNVVGAAPL